MYYLLPISKLLADKPMRIGKAAWLVYILKSFTLKKYRYNESLSLPEQ